MESTPFKIKMDSVLNILCKEIYDSPLSMLRENVQNAYDAILMRRKAEEGFANGSIIITIEGNLMKVEDNGIGMTYENLENNFWTAGSSGKNNDFARSAGVVGTFGIGAMANFGVCTDLQVITRHYSAEKTISSKVKKSQLSVTEKCIIYEDIPTRQEPGTTVIATLDESSIITINQAKDYLLPFVKYIPIPVVINGESISQTSYVPEFENTEKIYSARRQADKNGLRFDCLIKLHNANNVQPLIYINNIYRADKQQVGDVLLDSSMQTIDGFRNGFGLADVPCVSEFKFGGVVNLVSLQPTAGRDALSRESVELVANITAIADEMVAQEIANTEMAENCREFQLYIHVHRRYDLSDYVQIRKASPTGGDDIRILLKDVKVLMDDKPVLYYLGKDPVVLSNYIGENVVLKPSADYTRRQIQMSVINKYGIKPISDDIRVSDIIEDDEQLSIAEIGVKVNFLRVIEEQYFIQNCAVYYATISHRMSFFVEYKNEKLIIYIHRHSDDVKTLESIYRENFFMLKSYVTDLIRARLYQKFADYVPTAKRGGTDALYQALQRKQEVMTIESGEMGNFDFLMEEYSKGVIDIDTVFNQMVKVKNSDKETLKPDSVGSVNEVFNQGQDPGMAENLQDKTNGEIIKPGVVFDPLPPIIRYDKNIEYKILRTEENVPILQGYKSFLAISDKMFYAFYDFFLQPHSTRIIWSMHKIIYIFTLTSNSLTLYYDIDLTEPLEENSTGGRAIVTSTIITKNRIFIPIIPELDHYFNITSGSRKFYVRFDSVRK